MIHTTEAHTNEQPKTFKNLPAYFTVRRSPAVSSSPPLSYLHPEELELLKPTMVPAPTSKSNDSSSGVKESEEVNLVPSSRKDPSIRRRELLGYLREPLREVCASHAAKLMRSKFAGALVLLETVLVGADRVL